MTIESQENLIGMIALLSLATMWTLWNLHQLRGTKILMSKLFQGMITITNVVVLVEQPILVYK
jgi:hypothetical protein